jgi:hypothetical protein
MAIRDLLTPSFDDNDEDEDDNHDAEADLLAKEAQFKLDLAIIDAIKTT